MPNATFIEIADKNRDDLIGDLLWVGGQGGRGIPPSLRQLLMKRFILFVNSVMAYETIDYLIDINLRREKGCVCMTTSITSNHNKNLGSGQTGNLAHNRRDFISRNVDRELVKNNIVYNNVPLKEGYEDAFGDAIDDYNRKQKRKDRKKYTKESYFKHLFGVEPDSENAQKIITSNARGKHEIKSFNEELFQVGDCHEFGHFMRDKYGNFIDIFGNPVKWNKHDRVYYDINGNEVTDSSNLMPNPKADRAKKILEIFFKGGKFKKVYDSNNEPRLERISDDSAEIPDYEIPSFEERNPSFHIVYAAMHNDEWHGTPHIHIDYIPVGSGYVKGPEKQVGFERALSDMGFTDKNQAYKEWRSKERELLKEICRLYGLETKTKEEEEQNNRGETYAPDVYAEAVRDAKADGQEIIHYAEQKAQELVENAAATAKDITECSEKQADTIVKQAQEGAQNIRQNAEREAENIVKEANREKSEIQAENMVLTEENDKLKNDIQDKRKQICALADIVEKMPKKKIQIIPFARHDTEKYEMDKNSYDDFMLALATMKRLVDNTLTSDENQKASEENRKYHEQLAREEEQRIVKQAEMRAREMVKEKEDELNSEKEKYTELKDNQTVYIFNTADEMVKNISPTYAKLDKEKRKKVLGDAYKQVRIEQINREKSGTSFYK